ncbi:MAG: hypothetical protein ACTTH5_08135 [Wolinella sp.]
MLRWLFLGAGVLFLGGCISPKADAFLVGAGVGAGLTCMAIKGDILCGHRGKDKTLWERQDSSFPDASIPYNMY